MIGLGFRIGSVAAVLAVLPALTGTIPGARLAWSAPVSLNVAVPAGVTLLGRAPGSTFTTTIPGIAINNASAAVTGTPTARSGLITEHLPNGTSRNSMLFLPEAGSRTMKCGINSAVFTYYTKNLVFLDYMKGAEDVSSGGRYNDDGTPRDNGGTYDANGVPQSTANITYSFQFPMDDGSVTPFGLRVITDGDIDIVLTGSNEPGTFYGRPPLTRTSDGFTTTWVSKPGGNGNVNVLAVTAIRTPPTFIALVREDEAAAWRAWKAGTRAHRFKDSWIATMSRFSRFRDLDWSAVNNATYAILPPDNISYRNIAGDQNYVPLAVKVEMCIAAGIDLWACLPKTTTDAQYQAMWGQFDRLRAAGHDVFNEWANEVWNGKFPTQGYATQQYDAMGLGVYDSRNGTASPPAPGYIDNTNLKQTWYNGYRSAQLAKLCRGRGYKWVIGCQPVSQNFATYVDQGLAYAGGSWSDFYGWTCSGYIGGNFAVPRASLNGGQGLDETAFQQQTAMVQAGDVDAAMDNIINYVGPHSLSAASASIGYWHDAKANADQRVLKLVGYEVNGVSIISSGTYDPANYPGYDPFAVTLAYSPLARGAAEASLLSLQQAGFDEVMYYDIGSGETLTDSGNGIWGITGHPAFDGVKDFLALPLSTSTAVAPPPATASTGFRYIVVHPDLTRSGYSASTFPYWRFGCAEATLYEGATALDKSVMAASIIDGSQAGNPVSRLIDGSIASSYITESGTGGGFFAIDMGATHRPDRLVLHECSEAAGYSFDTGTIYGTNDLAGALTLLATRSPPQGGSDYVDGDLSIPLSYPS
ncbi:hypothetical protein [Sphingomonas bacterium]|uniref:hypothetical protein n=1 Tax=Sphingomonas bacterium TaxID=1895847 RepID=UPI001575C785|nr:hypothetical protein [Sphingomonas bacterium]